MPQMAPLMWLTLYLFFLVTLSFFLAMNYYIKPFQVSSFFSHSSSLSPKPWKL